MKPRSCVLLVVTFLAVGCAHNGTSTFSLSPTAPSFHQEQLTFTAAEQSPSNPGEVAEDTNEEDLDLGDDLDFLDEEDVGEPIEIWDPLVKFNRAMYHFNDNLYFWLLKPVARGYSFVVPEFARIGVRNFFNNILFPIRFVNCILQANLSCAGIELSRLVVNTIWGVGGLVDASANKLNMKMQDEDTGQTLGVWGFGNGFYVTWPVFGPSSTRDTVGMVGDYFLNPITYVEPWYVSSGIKAYQKVNEVSLKLGDYEALKEAAIDPYIAIRDAYIQYRHKKVQERGVKPEKQESSE
jgi:phospholipid-binding lipoprotein MlaA